MIYSFYGKDSDKPEPIAPVPGSLKLTNEVIALLANGENIKDWTKVKCVACDKLYAVPPGEKYVEICENQSCQKSRLDTIEYIQKQQQEQAELMKKLIGS